jgi:hypothetical protein
MSLLPFARTVCSAHAGSRYSSAAQFLFRIVARIGLARHETLMGKLPGKCIFCGGGNLTKEHFWPDWVGTVLGISNTVNRVEDLWTRSPGQPVPKLINRQERPGPTHKKKKIRKVCSTCNNGWMSEIENELTTVLGPLIVDREVTLSPEDQHTLAIWTTLKTFIAEWSIPNNVVPPQELRTDFMTSRTIPPNLTIWIAQCGRDGWEAAYYRDVHTIGLSPEERFFRTSPNIQCLTFGVGGLLVHVRHLTIEGLSINLNTVEERLIFQIWPNPAKAIQWPPSRRLQWFEASRIAHVIDWLRTQPNVRWIE